MRKAKIPSQSKSEKLMSRTNYRPGCLSFFQTIQDAKYEAEEQFDFDDALQADRLSGGKVGDARRPFVF